MNDNFFLREDSQQTQSLGDNNTYESISQNSKNHTHSTLKKYKNIKISTKRRTKKNNAIIKS